jgi:two-component system, NarL family, nitrate/nitrite response regulator NarL
LHTRGSRVACLPGGCARILDLFLIARTRFYREGLADALARVEGIHVAGAASGPEDALARVGLLAPDVVLLDTAVVGMLDLVRELTASSPGTRVVALALPERASEVVACAEAGVSGYVTEEASLADLVATVEGVARGEMRCSPTITATLLRRVAVLAAGHRAVLSPPKLTARELEVLVLLDDGLSNQQIARRLCIELATVKNHVHHILEKLQIERRGEAGAYLRRHPQLGPSTPSRSPARG